MKVSEEQVHTVFGRIMELPSRGYVAYAKSYAGVGLDLSGMYLVRQVPYVLVNLQHWRGDEARECKEVLTAFLKERGE